MRFRIVSACMEHLPQSKVDEGLEDDDVWIPAQSIPVDFVARFDTHPGHRVDMSLDEGCGNIGTIDAELPLLQGTWAALRCTWFDEQGRPVFSAPVSWKTFQLDEGDYANVALWSCQLEDPDEPRG